MTKGVSKPRKVSTVRHAENVQKRVNNYKKLGGWSKGHTVQSVGEQNAYKKARAGADAAKRNLDLRINRRKQENLK